MKAIFVNKDKTPITSFESPVANTLRGNKVMSCHKCSEDGLKNPLDSWI